MGYSIKKDENGEFLAIPLELPLYDGNSPELFRQALTSLGSAMRHFAIFEAYHDEGLADNDILEYGETAPFVDQHIQQGTEQLISTMISLASVADYYGIDIMQEIYDVPWMV